MILENVTKAELSILNSVTLGDAEEYKLNMIRPYSKDFSYNGRKLFQMLERKFKNNEKWDDKAIEEEGISKDYMFLILDEDEGYRLQGKESYITIFKEFEKEKAKNLAKEMLGMNDIEKLEKNIEKLNNVFTSTRKIEKINLADASKKFFENIDNLEIKKQVKTRNWLRFNKSIKLYKGDITIIAGRPGAGKTAFALSLALELAKQGNKGIYFSLEMGEEQIINRIMSQLSQVSLNKFQDTEGYKSLQEEEHAKILQACESMNKLAKGLQIVSGNFSSSDIYEISKQEKELDYIIIDYMQLLQCSQGNSRVEQITYLSMELKRIAMKLQIPIIELCQLSRAVEQRADKHPMLSDLRESGQLEQDASIVIGLYRDSYYNDECEDSTLLEVGILKNRNGAQTNIEFEFVGHIQRIYERM